MESVYGITERVFYQHPDVGAEREIPWAEGCSSFIVECEIAG